MPGMSKHSQEVEKEGISCGIFALRETYLKLKEKEMTTPLDELNFPVTCTYCEEGPFANADEVNEHITKEHLPEAVWSFASAFFVSSEVRRKHETKRKTKRKSI